MKIIADRNMTAVESLFARHGAVRLVDGRSICADTVADADVLLVRSVTRVDARLLHNSRVRFVGSATSGYDHVDRDYLSERDIDFAYAPGANANSVVEYVLSAMANTPGTLERLLAGGRVGIIGFGIVGRKLAQRLSALSIDCIAYDPWLDQSAHPQLTALEQVLACDVVSVHAELTLQQPHPSWHLLQAGTLSQLAPGTLLINAARGSIIDNAALLTLLQAEPDLQVVLDVWEHEPEVDAALMRQCRFASPHIAGYSYDSKLLATRMLHQACCQQLQLTDPGTGDNSDTRLLQVPTHLQGAALIAWLQAQSYDIRADDQRMREQLASGFDWLRRHYPQRRELNMFRVSNSSELTAAAQAVCAAMGCSTC